MAAGADGLVHVAANLPARWLYDPNDNSYRFDALVLSMLDNATPIPADLGSSFPSAWISPFVDIPSSNGELAAAAASRPPGHRLLRLRFSIPAHQRGRVDVRLGEVGSKLLERARRGGERVRLRARATVGSRVTTTAITLRLARHR